MAEDKLKAEARNAAEKRLRDANADEFRRYMEEEHAARGLTYSPRLTKEERARREIQRLAAEHGLPVVFEDEVPTVEPVEVPEHVADAVLAVKEGRLPEGAVEVDPQTYTPVNENGSGIAR